MADVISLAEHRAARRRAAVAGGPAVPKRRVAFFFDLASPFTYLAVERIDRLFPGARWVAASGEALHRGDPWRDPVARDAADRRARALHIPLSWPDRPSEGARGAMRAAAYAADCDRAANFVVAASRLAFCGGFDLDDPEVLAEAAAAADLGLESCLAAARDEARDGAIEEAGRQLLAAGADRLPAVRVAGLVFAGEQRIAEAAMAVRSAGKGRMPYAG
jgi:2-hydroxychromene-2-carboxylate isomerase